MESTKNLPMVAAVTAIDTPTGTKVLGLGVSAYNDSPDQDESLANPNMFVCNIDEGYKIPRWYKVTLDRLLGDPHRSRGGDNAL